MLSTTRVPGEAVGPYGMTAPTRAGNVGNYSITYVAGTFTITGKAVTVAATNNGKIYGALDPALGATQSGFLARNSAGQGASEGRDAGGNGGRELVKAVEAGGHRRE